MKFHKDLYVSPNIRHLAAIKWRLKHEAGNLALYVIVPADNDPHSRAGENQLEMMHCWNLQQPWARKIDWLIVGIAEGRAEGFELIRRMTQDCYEARGDEDLKAFLFPKENTHREGVQT
ncbi:MAG: hypothetical protein SOH60_05430 [Lachnospiraceae bacterium]|jgi:hypothetical protein